ncbi:hypothetical protein [Limimaricola soesokkakensis]|uniref:hypothetical protein n=1 Tax=Limimaricola soesokkakensis TaxID=1343159 RepID=UPI00351106C6
MSDLSDRGVDPFEPSRSPKDFDLKFSSHWMRSFIFYGIPSISLLSVCMSFIKGRNDNVAVIEFADRFILNNEASIPTLLSIVLMWMASQLCALNYFYYQKIRKSRLNLYWIASSLFLLAMAYDESAQVHETLRWSVFGDILNGQSWIFVGIPIVGVLGVLFIPFLLSPPRRLKMEIGKGAAIFVLGAIVIEGVGGVYKANLGMDFTYNLLTVLEEATELVGVSYVNLVLLRHAAENRISIDFCDHAES